MKGETPDRQLPGQANQSAQPLKKTTYYCDAGDDDNNCDGGNEYDHDDNQNKYCGLIHINKAYNCPSQINVNSTISEFHGKIEANTKVSFKYKYEYKYKYEQQRQR